MISKSAGLKYKIVKNEFKFVSPIPDIINILKIAYAKKYEINVNIIYGECILQLFHEFMNIVKITIHELEKLNTIYKMI